MKKELKSLKERILSAKGEVILDLKLKNCKVVSTFTSEILECDIGIKNGYITTLNAKSFKAKEEIDLKGLILSPSFIDSHIHIESSMLTPNRFAEIVVPLGTGAVISDPHEIANVLGLKGIKLMFDFAKNSKMDFFFTIPSCVPATNLETSGGKIGVNEIKKLKLISKGTLALSEMMNYVGVVNADEEVLKKIIISQKEKLLIDGHAPMLRDNILDTYLNPSIHTDHESTTVDEILEKIRKGVFILIREGSASKNLKEAIKVINSKNIERFAFASDDRDVDTLINEGHINDILKKAVKYGLEPLDAIRLATLNPSRIYGIKNKGAIAPSYYADLVALKDLKSFEAVITFYRGELVAREGELLTKKDGKIISKGLSPLRLKKDLDRRLNYVEEGKVWAIEVKKDQILTEKKIYRAEDAKEGRINYLAVMERYGKNGNIGLGFIANFNLKKGAIASTIAHDSHNIVAVGRTPEDILKTVNRLQKLKGGVVVFDGLNFTELPLEVGGLMTNRDGKEVLEIEKRLLEKIKSLGVDLPSPIVTLSFIALPVIPEIRLTDMGLVDVYQFKVIPLKIG